MERFGRRVMFKNKMKKSDGMFSKLREGSSPFKINIVADCMASLLHKICFHMSVFSPPFPFQADSVSRTHRPANLLHLLWIYCWLATAADALCLPALVPTSFSQEHCAWFLGQGPRWVLNLCPPGWSLLWYNFKLWQFAVHSWSLSRPIETKWHRQCDAFLIVRSSELCFWTCVQGSSSEVIVFFFSLFLRLCSLSVSLFCVCCWLVVHWLFKIIIVKDWS